MCEHVLTVMVRDQGTPAKRNYARVIIYVSDANDHSPEWTGGVVQGRVLETADIGTAVVTVLASDKDHGNNAALTYSIVTGTLKLHQSQSVGGGLLKFLTTEDLLFKLRKSRK